MGVKGNRGGGGSDVRSFQELQLAEDHLWAWEPDALSCLLLPPNPQTLIDLCAQKPCPRNSHCLQTGPSFQCLCLQGWTGPLCEVPLSSCQKAALSQGTTPRTDWGADEEKKGALLHPIAKGIHTFGQNNALRVETTRTNRSD